MLMFSGFVEGKMTFSNREDFPKFFLGFEKSAFEVPNFIGGGGHARRVIYAYMTMHFLIYSPTYPGP